MELVHGLGCNFPNTHATVLPVKEVNWVAATDQHSEGLVRNPYPNLHNHFLSTTAHLTFSQCPHNGTAVHFSRTLYKCNLRCTPDHLNGQKTTELAMERLEGQSLELQFFATRTCMLSSLNDTLIHNAAVCRMSGTGRREHISPLSDVFMLAPAKSRAEFYILLINYEALLLWQNC